MERQCFISLQRSQQFSEKFLDMTLEGGPLEECDIPLMLDMEQNSALDILLAKKDLNTIDKLLAVHE